MSDNLILICGATGFVGKAVQKKLEKHTVCLTSRSEPLDNSIGFFQKGISRTTDFSDCIADIDVVIHFAGIKLVSNFYKNPLESMEICLLYTSPSPRDS